MPLKSSLRNKIHSTLILSRATMGLLFISHGLNIYILEMQIKLERKGCARFNGREDILFSFEFVSQREGKRDRHKIIVGWMIYQATLGQNTKQYLQLIQTTWFCKFLSKLKSRFLQALKGNSFLNYWVIFSTPIELYNQTWSKHCTRKHNRKWIQQNYDFMDPQLQKGVRNENGKCMSWTLAGF